jgi:hypothetical protein
MSILRTKSLSEQDLHKIRGFFVHQVATIWAAFTSTWIHQLIAVFPPLSFEWQPHDDIIF